MKQELTRRSFAILSLAVATVLPHLPAANTVTKGYVNPHLLVEPDELIGAVSAMTPSQAEGTATAIVVIDVRKKDAYDAGHIPGARHLDPNAVVAANSPISGSLKTIPELERLLSRLGISADHRVVLYDNRGGFHAARMFWLLEYLGHQNVALLNGGYDAWRAIDGPTTKIRFHHARARFQAAPSPRRFASADYVLKHRSEPGEKLIDVRPTKMYTDGHIPWAINIPWAQNLGEGNRFLSAEKLRKNFEAQGITTDDSVTLHCQVGLASAHSYVALRLLGYPQVRVYHRSWAEWGSDPSLPKVSS
ncbi:sulfurtransferase [uncultured Roseobacter sp.]|uniref:sulfurtransferase n=1 Tax=uncultured Roseobacter sp. TaxID=114847 RepID=UPI0026246A29|nr:sulfurtransferase [uncultured Roseobacter sp.]